MGLVTFLIALTKIVVDQNLVVPCLTACLFNLVLHSCGPMIKRIGKIKKIATISFIYLYG